MTQSPIPPEFWNLQDAEDARAISHLLASAAINAEQGVGFMFLRGHLRLEPDAPPEGPWGVACSSGFAQYLLSPEQVRAEAARLVSALPTTS